jgi:hypothetical protein
VNRIAIGVTAVFVVALVGPTHARPGDARQQPSERRADLIRRAQVWKPTHVASMDLLHGPSDPRGFAPGARVTCDYVPTTLSGNSPKFACLLSPGDKVKVKYGGTNGEVYGEVLATRLLWALGFGADHMYSVRVVCHGGPATIGNVALANGDRLVDPAAIERKMPGREIVIDGVDGWAWRELEAANEEAGGAPRAHRDALKLLAAFMQHTDSKPTQQRLVCLDAESKESDSERCDKPFMLLNDVGLTFGRANLYNRQIPGSVDLAAWSTVPVWKPGTPCRAWLPETQTGTLADPVISEEGRAFLAGLLAELTDAQLHDLFAAARVQLRPRDPASGRSGFPTIDEWVDAFKAKRTQIVNRRCA